MDNVYYQLVESTFTPNNTVAFISTPTVGEAVRPLVFTDLIDGGCGEVNPRNPCHSLMISDLRSRLSVHDTDGLDSCSDCRKRWRRRGAVGEAEMSVDVG